MRYIIVYLLSLLALKLGAQVEYLEYKVPAIGDRVGMIVHEPKKIDSSILYKLIIAHPGIGERGSGSSTDLEKLRVSGTWVTLEKRIREKGGYILIQVQPKNNYEHGETDEALQWAKNVFGGIVNWNKVYITGLSLGGGGTGRYLSVNPHADTIFAAAAIVCPGPNPFFILEQNYKNIAKYAKGRPVWFLHSKDDSTVTPAQSTNLTISKIKAIDTTVQVRRTLYKYERHGSWVRAYGDNPAATPGLAEDYNDPVAGVLEFFELNDLSRPAKFLARKSDPVPAPAPDRPADTVKVPVDTVVVRPDTIPLPGPVDTAVVVVPDTAVVLPPVDTIPAPAYLIRWTHSHEYKLPPTGIFEAWWSDGTKTTYRTPIGDQIRSSYGIFDPKTGKVRVVLDVAKGPDIVVGPYKK